VSPASRVGCNSSKRSPIASSDHRLAGLLVAHVDPRESSFQLTHQALADQLGSVREIVTRLLRSFEDRGWIELGRERIVVRDRPALDSLARR